VILDLMLAAVAVAVAFVSTWYRDTHPYQVVGYSFATGMVAVRWRDDPTRTPHWLTPAHLAQQKGLHR
jgi:hypothetical protein